MKLFLSYASEQKDFADRLALALRNDGHTVFFDQDDLPAAGNYNQRLRMGVKASDVFVFLISPQSVARGSYARAELDLARRYRPRAAGRLLPVMAVPTDYAEIPNYAKSVTVLEPEGDTIAAVLQAVSEIEPPDAGWKQIVGSGLLLLALGLAGYQAFVWAWPRQSQTGVIVTTAVAAIAMAGICWVIWHRFVRANAWQGVAIPGAAALLSAAGLTAAVAAEPLAVWLLPGTSWGTELSGNSNHDLEISGLSAPIADVPRSGVLLFSNPKAGERALARDDDDLQAALLAYVRDRDVSEQFQNAWVSAWRGEPRIEQVARSALAGSEGWEVEIVDAARGTRRTQLHWRDAGAVLIAFVEVQR